MANRVAALLESMRGTHTPGRRTHFIRSARQCDRFLTGPLSLTNCLN